MKESPPWRPRSSVAVLFAVLIFCGGSLLSAGRIERGISQLRAGNEHKALDLFTEAWVSGEGEERQLAMFYLNLVAEGGKGTIPPVEEARAALRVKQESARMETVERPARAARGGSSYAQDGAPSGVRSAAVIFHTPQAKRAYESAYGGDEEELSRESDSGYGAGRPRAKQRANYKKTAAYTSGNTGSVPPRRPAAHRGRLEKPVGKYAAASAPPAAVASRYRPKAAAAPASSVQPRARAQKLGEEDDIPAGASGEEPLDKEKDDISAPASVPYRETIMADAGAGDDVIGVGETSVPGREVKKAEEETSSEASSPYRETVEVGGAGSGTNVVALASKAVRKETPSGLRPADGSFKRPADTSEIKVQASDGETSGPVAGYYGAQSSSVAVVAIHPGEDTAGADIKTARLKGKKKTFVIEDAYEVEDEQQNESVSEVRFKADELELAGDAMSAVEAAARKFSKGGSVTVRGLSSPTEKNAENLSKIRAKLVERLLKKKFDIPSGKMTVEWGIGVNRDDQKVLIVVKT